MDIGGGGKGVGVTNPPHDPGQRFEGPWGPIVVTLGPTMRREPGGPDRISGGAERVRMG